ncbi:F0F1 ATP synthase subunit delta [Corynebacterium sp.]|uniref:F0F1 ATP synthase subunit delta n=1 Tax=Corynebacterium sp. TaxID=1720 RepID=UPI0026DD44B2|nr:F0F1 ATP synthase subunit delta [Corynebacterium sp.]MDO5033174.1 F0F1 ATP synthase subunit delta [Corynebacterium sp.]
MKAASREALAHVENSLDQILAGEPSVATATQAGQDLFEVADVLDGDRELRVALVDAAAPTEARQSLVRTLFGSKVSAVAQRVIDEAVAAQWSSARDLVKGLVTLGRRALLRGAEADGKLGQVEDELFTLSRILDREGELTQLLSDRTATSDRKAGLLASVLYGKVTMVTEALASQAIRRPEQNPIDDLFALAETAAQLQGRTIARVTSAGELNDSQRAALAEKLGNIYGRAMSIHSEVDTSLLGGMTIRVGDEVIDGSTAGKIARLRAQMV